MKKRKMHFDEGGEVPPGGRFTSDVYERARKFREDQERRAGEGDTSGPEPVKPSRARAKPKADDSVMEGMKRTQARKDTLDDQYEAAKANAKPMTPEPGLEGVYPESLMVGGPMAAGVRALNAMRAGRAAAASRAADMAAREETSRKVGEMFKPSGKTTEETVNELKDAIKSAFPAAERSRGMRQTARAMEEAKPILQARPASKPGRMGRTKYNQDESGVEFRKGGKVSQASSRGDGCCTKGKTKGRMI